MNTPQSSPPSLEPDENSRQRRHRFHWFAHRSVLQEAGHDVAVIDNLINASEKSLHRVADTRLRLLLPRTGEGTGAAVVF
ncbi:hypothetical protein NicSoilB8_19290 [Arthrobacter sp. NicSoilB8]|nr:hypothetical protein NicSoilB8_19290 [Arthrobacter sp. NicSoilB8]